MVMLATLSLAIALQVPTNIPRDAEVIYPLMPRVSPVANADGSKVDLLQSIHSVTATLGKKEAVLESLSLYKNTASVEGTVDLIVAFESWRSGFGAAIKVEAVWSDQKVEATGPVRVLQSLPEKGQIGTYAMTFSVPVKKQATHSLRLKFTLPIGVSGVDREERMVAYRLADIKQDVPLDQFRMAVKYSPEIVFAPIEAKPDWGWQIGADGAYLKLDGKRADRDAVLTFRYYPPSF